MTYDNKNRGTLSKNTRKTQDSHPDIKGQINIDGVEYWLDGWQRTSSKDGSKFYSLSVKPKEARQERRQGYSADKTQRHPAFDPTGMDDDFPF